MNFRVEPISVDVARSVRDEKISPQYGHPAFTEIATGYGPCRHCLRKFEEGTEERILFTYNAFEGLLDIPLPGPVFIHLRDCKRYSTDGFPPELIDLPLLFESYTADGSIASTVAIDAAAPEDQIARLLADDSTRFINIRNAEAGCHVANIFRK